MLLRSTTNAEASDERELRLWLVNRFGAVDEETLSEWVWTNHGRNGVRYVEALAEIVRNAHERGNAFVHAILDFIRSIKPECREAVGVLIEYVSVRADRATKTIIRHGGAKVAILGEVENLRGDVRAEVHRLWPDKHRATIDGALLGAFTLDPRTFAIKCDYFGIVLALDMQDPLHANARASWRV